MTSEEKNMNSIDILDKVLVKYINEELAGDSEFLAAPSSIISKEAYSLILESLDVLICADIAEYNIADVAFNMIDIFYAGVDFEGEC